MYAVGLPLSYSGMLLWRWDMLEYFHPLWEAVIFTNTLFTCLILTEPMQKKFKILFLLSWLLVDMSPALYTDYLLQGTHFFGFQLGVSSFGRLFATVFSTPLTEHPIQGKKKRIRRRTSRRVT